MTKTQRRSTADWLRRLPPALLLTAIVGLPMATADAQVPLSPAQLDQLVARIALYPDPLLAQALTASTYSDQIPDAAQWADEHSYLKGDTLARATSQDNVPWDASVLALLPFPSVLDMMASNIFWTRQLGDAVLGQRAEVMDAVQRMRQRANSYGYLRDWPDYRILVSGPGLIEILPIDPAFCVLPVYDPVVVFARPRTSGFIGITFGPRIALGTAFASWGWGRSGFAWPSHTLMVDGRPWLRTRVNHETYAHPYVEPRHSPGPRVEQHELRPTHPGRSEGRRDTRR